MSFDMNEEGTEKENIWIKGEIKEVSNGTWLKGPRAIKACWKEGEAARVYWDLVPDAGYDKNTTSVERFDPNKWNQNCEGAWRKDVGTIDYGL